MMAGSIENQKTKKTKVLIIQRRVREYRVPVFNELAKKTDLTVLHMEDREITGAEFTVLRVESKRFIFKTLKTFLMRLANQFDVVICMADYSYPQFLLLSLLPRKFKLIYWGIGVDASYEHRYDGDPKVVRNLARLFQRADAALFYSDYPIHKYIECGISPDKLFVAPNTVQVEYAGEGEKNTFLFLGSLYPQKRVDLLIDQYIKAFRKNNDLPDLIIIGDGNEREKLEKMAKDSEAAGKILFKGAIFDDRILAQYFSNAVLCLSPDQAGLSVLKSMGNGVPYVTHKDAITGGEIFNIHHGVDGVLLERFEDMEQLFLDAAENPERYQEMGRAAHAYYIENRTVSHMVAGFVDAINYVKKV